MPFHYIAPPRPPRRDTTAVRGNLQRGLRSEKYNKPAFTMDEDPMYFTAVATINPEPATLILLGSGLAGVFGAMARRRQRRT